MFPVLLHQRLHARGRMGFVVDAGTTVIRFRAVLDASGNHYVNGALVGDGELDASRPEVLIYEASGGGLQLVGVEFVVIADAWLAHHDSPPVLEGRSFQFVSSPNRYGLPAHFELHVWAWRDNPNGAFVDWNNKVTCEGE